MKTVIIKIFVAIASFVSAHTIPVIAVTGAVVVTAVGVPIAVTTIRNNNSSQVIETSSTSLQEIISSDKPLSSESDVSSEPSSSADSSNIGTSSLKTPTTSTSPTKPTSSIPQGTASVVTPTPEKAWEYKNGGDDYIIKTDGKTTIKIPVDISKYEFPKNDATHTYEVTITRNAVQKINNWIYFFEVYNLSCNWWSDDPAFDGAGAWTSTKRGLYRIKEDGSSLQQISETTDVTNENEPHPTCHYVVGFDGPDMYFLKTMGYGAGGTLCKITIKDNIEYIVDNATIFNTSFYIPTSSYIKDGKIYLFGLGDNNESSVISISELKVK